MAFRTQASIDPNNHKGLILLNSITGSPLVATGTSLTNSQPLHVAIVDGSGSQVVPIASGSTVTIQGNKTNNNAAPGATNVGVLPAIATAGAPSYTEGNQVGLSTDLSGALRVSGSISVGGTTDNSAFTAGTSTGTPAMGFYHSTIDTVTDGRAAAVGITSKRAMLVNLQSSTGSEMATRANPLLVEAINNDIVDSNNSSTATLLANASFTGVGTSTLDASFIQVYVYSDQSSATNGVKIEFSSDNVNWNDGSTFSFVAGGAAPNDGQTYGAPTRGQYYRVVYTNGAVNQTAFRLQTVLKADAGGGDMVSMNYIPNSTNHAQLTKSSIIGLTTGGGGGFVDVKVNPSGSLVADVSNSTGLAGSVTSIQNSVSTANSTTTPLGANGVFTGTFEDISNFIGIGVLVRTDQNSATDGAVIQWSDDGVNVRRTSVTTITGSASQGYFFSSPRQARYFRVSYTNGATPQTTFVAQTIKNTVAPGGSVIPLFGALDINASGLLTRSVITGQTTAGGNSFVNVKVNPSGTLTVDASNSTGIALAANQSVNVSQIGGSSVSTAATGVQKVGIVGNAGATIDSTVGAGTAPTNQVVVGAVYNSTEISPTTGQAFALQADSKGRVRGVIYDAAGNTRGANVNASNQLSVSVDNANVSTNLAQVNGATTLAGNGVSGTGALRVTVASDSTGQVAPAASSTATGTAIYNNTALSNTKQAVNASAGNLYGYHIYNPNSSVIYVQLFNVASAGVTVGTTAPTAVIAVPAGGWADSTPATPIAFGTALTIAATTTSTGAGAPTTALLANFWYK